MPCDYNEYHPKWSLIRRLILKRARHRCEKCGLKNHSLIRKEDRRTPGRDEWEMFWRLLRRQYSRAQAMKVMAFTKIILTIAHLDHDKTNNRFWNLMAWCQKCHLEHDLPHHINNRKYGRNWKKNQIKMNL